MKKRHDAFNQEHMHNIKNIFEEKTGVRLDKKVSNFTHRKLVAVTAAAILCLSIGTPVLAANVPTVYELMYHEAPSLAQFFMPIQKSVEDNGIKMEVVSAHIYDSVAEIYITLQDLTGDRIDETIDLNDSYSINRPFDSVAYCNRVAYEEETKTATFLITIQEWGNQKITGDKITFSVKEFMSGKNYFNNIKIPIDLSSVTSAISTQKVESTGGGGRDYPMEEGGTIVLTPEQAIEGLEVEGIDVTAIGYIEDKFHVQMAVRDRLQNDNHGFFYLVDDAGKRVEGSYNIYFTNQYKEQVDRIDYCEYVFDIPREELKDYSLFGDFVTSGMLTEGSWRVTFPLEK